MVRKFVSATVSAALCFMTVAPAAALAQEYRFAGFDAPRGATATVNLRVPMGREKAGRASYGLTLGYGHTVAPGFDDRTAGRGVDFADLRFASGGELRHARLASFDLAALDQDRRLNMVGGGKKSTWLLIGAIVVAGVAICVAADCFDDDDEDEDNM